MHAFRQPRQPQPDTFQTPGVTAHTPPSDVEITGNTTTTPRGVLLTSAAGAFAVATVVASSRGHEVFPHATPESIAQILPTAGIAFLGRQAVHGDKTSRLPDSTAEEQAESTTPDGPTLPGAETGSTPSKTDRIRAYTRAKYSHAVSNMKANTTDLRNTRKAKLDGKAQAKAVEVATEQAEKLRESKEFRSQIARIAATRVAAEEAKLRQKQHVVGITKSERSKLTARINSKLAEQAFAAGFDLEDISAIENYDHFMHTIDPDNHSYPTISQSFATQHNHATPLVFDFFPPPHRRGRKHDKFTQRSGRERAANLSEEEVQKWLALDEVVGRKIGEAAHAKAKRDGKTRLSDDEFKEFAAKMRTELYQQAVGCKLTDQELDDMRQRIRQARDYRRRQAKARTTKKARTTTSSKQASTDVVRYESTAIPNPVNPKDVIEAEIVDN